MANSLEDDKSLRICALTPSTTLVVHFTQTGNALSELHAKTSCESSLNELVKTEHSSCCPIRVSKCQSPDILSSEEKSGANNEHQHHSDSDKEDFEDRVNLEIRAEAVSDIMSLQKPVSFAQKLMEVLSNDIYSLIVSWLPHGMSFIIHNIKRFVSDLLPVHFKSAKYSSFTRRLRRWGFQTVLRGPETGAYYHEMFRRDNKELCHQMTCDKPKQRSNVACTNQGAQSTASTPAATRAAPEPVSMTQKSDSTSLIKSMASASAVDAAGAVSMHRYELLCRRNIGNYESTDKHHRHSFNEDHDRASVFHGTCGTTLDICDSSASGLLQRSNLPPDVMASSGSDNTWYQYSRGLLHNPSFSPFLPVYHQPDQTNMILPSMAGSRLALYDIALSALLQYRINLAKEASRSPMVLNRRDLSAHEVGPFGISAPDSNGQMFTADYDNLTQHILAGRLPPNSLYRCFGKGRQRRDREDRRSVDR